MRTDGAARGFAGIGSGFCAFTLADETSNKSSMSWDEKDLVRPTTLISLESPERKNTDDLRLIVRTPFINRTHLWLVTL